LYNSGRSGDYPFGYLQVKLNEKDEGMGQIMAAAKLKFNKKSGHYEVESYGNQYIKRPTYVPGNRRETVIAQAEYYRNTKLGRC
jgi:hypothetical protein